ncbi:MAG: hypothetical protein A3C47_06530 [Omnitrophica bacterium RIFCSPHIGHO2_02_FULL_51_18]|nr:MAG: hypothetical protein A3C47_06530 [Omnitrophica bacterium RIFCSPHIGHO2_02_FULL_51_18]
MPGAGLSLPYLDRISCFESLRAYDGRLFCLGAHVDRLWESCHTLGRPLPFLKNRIRRWIREVLEGSGFKDALLRVSVHWDGAGEGRVVAIARHFAPYADEIYEKGIGIKTAVNRRWTLRAQDPQIKSSQYVSGVLASLDLSGSLPHEVVFLSQDQCVAEGTVSNLFIVASGKTILTPPVSSGILRGVTREVVIVLAGEIGLRVLEKPLTRHEIYSADECFITNTSSEVLPVAVYDGRKIAGSVPGPVTKMLRKHFKDFIKQKKEI